MSTHSFMTACLVSFAFTTLFGLSIAQANIVSNGDFETGNFDNWSQLGNTTFVDVTSNPDFVYAGNYSAELGAGLGPNYESALYQTLSTTAGKYYTLSFWLQYGGGYQNINYFAVDFLEHVPYLATDENPVFKITNQTYFPYTHFNVPLYANNDSMTLKFSFGTYIPDNTAFWLDNISIEETNQPVPEPGILPLFIVGLGSLGLLNWFKNHKKTTSLSA